MKLNQSLEYGDTSLPDLLTFTFFFPVMPATASAPNKAARASSKTVALDPLVSATPDPPHAAAPPPFAPFSAPPAADVPPQAEPEDAGPSKELWLTPR